jgi:hypothetical protein
VAAGSAVDYVRWRRTRYRITAGRVELRTEILISKDRSLQRDRIRAVDVTVDPLLRAVGLVAVRVGTGEQSGAGEGSVGPVRRATVALQQGGIIGWKFRQSVFQRAGWSPWSRRRPPTRCPTPDRRTVSPSRSSPCPGCWTRPRGLDATQPANGPFVGT